MGNKSALITGIALFLSALVLFGVFLLGIKVGREEVNQQPNRVIFSDGQLKAEIEDTTVYILGNIVPMGDTAYISNERFTVTVIRQMTGVPKNTLMLSQGTWKLDNSRINSIFQPDPEAINQTK